MGTKIDLDIRKEEISDFCKKNYVKKLSVFGSAIRNELNPDSDIDILVEFDSNCIPGFFDLYRMEEELSLLFDGRKIDLRTPADLSRYFRNNVLNTAEVVYVES